MKNESMSYEKRKVLHSVISRQHETLTRCIPVHRLVDLFVSSEGFFKSTQILDLNMKLHIKYEVISSSWWNLYIYYQSHVLLKCLFVSLMLCIFVEFCSNQKWV